MPTDRIDIRHVARLARLALTDAEIATFGPQLGDLMTHVDELAELDTQDVRGDRSSRPVAKRAARRRDPARDDAVPARRRCRTRRSRRGRYFRVPRIIAEEG